MIILFDENETLFSGLGLGVLRDAISCTVTESLNDEYTLAMEYPVKGNIFSQLQLNRIIYCRPNPYSSAQPFRVYSITKPLDGKVSVAAYHISYDMNDVPVGTINGQNIQDALNQIQNGVIIDDCPFKLYTDMTSTKKFKTTSPYNMRALLMGSDESILEKYDAEVRFDKWNAYITKQRGRNRGVQVRYAKNMTELSHELNYERLYNGVYPFYHKETTSTTSTTTTGDFKQVYIVGKKPYQAGWLSYSAGGTAYQPVDESPVQIASDGDWKGKVYCWNSVTQRYVEKLYNQTVTLVQGVISPDWIKIDWGSLPKIVCQAAADGYFKTTTDTTWTYHASGETVFEGSITDISGLASNMILYYSEVIPSDSSSSSNTDTNVTHIELPEKIIWLNTDDAKAMKRNRILMLDLSSEFSDDDEDDDDEDDTSTSTTTTTTTTNEDSSDSDDSDVPTVDELRAKAEKYIKKNKIGTIKFETSLSFVDLSSTTEKEKYKDFEQIELGDTVKVVYNELGINIDLRVITTEYDVLKNAYEQVELGEKSDTLSASSVQNGDDISSLTNDSDYASTSTVSKLIAKTVTADYIQAQNAKLTSAQITELTSARIKCTGILEASQLELDKLVAKMLITDDAEIANTLSAGQVKVAGDITVNSGQISITNGEKVFSVTREGDLTANSVTITGGSLNINNGTFEVTNDGLMTATGADISGRIQATDGIIGGFTIGENAIYNSITGMEDQTSNGVYLGVDGIKLGDKFSVTNAGLLTTTSGLIGTYTISKNSISVGFPEGFDDNGSLVNYPGLDVTYITKNGIRVGNYPTYMSTPFKDTALAEGASTSRKSLPHTDGMLLTGKVNNISFYITAESSNAARKLKLEFYNSMTDGEAKADYTQEIEMAANETQTNVTLEYDKAYYYLQLTATSGSFASLTMQSTPLTGLVMLRNNGALIANNVRITGGSLDVGDGVFSVDDKGNLVAKSAKIDGAITATSGGIGGFIIKDNYLYNGDIDSWTSEGQNGVYIGKEGIRLGKSYKITPAGAFSAGDDTTNISCGISSNGKLTAKDADIIGKITANSGYIGTADKGFYISSNCICSRDFDEKDLPEYFWYKDSIKGLYIGNDAIRLGQNVSRRKSGSQDSVGVYDSASLKIDFSSVWEHFNGLSITVSFDKGTAVRYLRIDALNSSGLATGSPMQLKKIVTASATSITITLAINEEYSIVRIMSDIDSSSGTFTNVSYQIAPVGVLMTRAGKLTANGAQIYGSFDGDVNITGGSLNINNGVFSVDKAGNMVANAATIKGKITATSGSFGCFSITGTDSISMSLDGVEVLAFEKSTDKRLPTYYLYGNSVYFNKMSFARHTEGDADYWMEARYGSSGTDTIGGLYACAFDYSSTEALIEGYISAKDFASIPIIDTNVPKTSGYNPKIWITQITLSSGQRYTAQSFSNLHPSDTIHNVMACIPYAMEDNNKVFSATINNTNSMLYIWAETQMTTTGKVGIILIYS